MSDLCVGLEFGGQNLRLDIFEFVLARGSSCDGPSHEEMLLKEDEYLDFSPKQD